MKKYHKTPVWLSKDKERAAMFQKVAKKVIEKYGYSTEDADSIAIIADGIIVYRGLCQHIIDNGIMVKGANGYKVKNPSFSLQVAVLKNITPLMSKFGFSPFDRTKIAELKKEKSLSDFMKVPD